jgi:hypothetical protein
MPDKKRIVVLPQGQKPDYAKIVNTPEKDFENAQKKIGEIGQKISSGTATPQEIGLFNYNQTLAKEFTTRLDNLRANADNYAPELSRLFNDDLSKLNFNKSVVAKNNLNLVDPQRIEDDNLNAGFRTDFQLKKNQFTQKGIAKLKEAEQYIKSGNAAKLREISEYFMGPREATKPFAGENAFGDQNKYFSALEQDKKNDRSFYNKEMFDATQRKTGEYLKTMAKAFEAKQKIELYKQQGKLNSNASLNTVLGNKDLVQEFGRDLLSKEYGSKLYGEDKRGLFEQIEKELSSNSLLKNLPSISPFLPSPGEQIKSSAQSTDYDASTLAINSIKALSEIDYRNKVAEATRLKLFAEKTGNKKGLEEADASLAKAQEDLESIKSFNTENFLKTNYRQTYLDKKEEEVEAQKRRKGLSYWQYGSTLPVDPVKLYYSVKSAGKKIYNNDVNLAMGLKSWFGGDSSTEKAKNSLIADMMRFDKTGYTIGVDEKGNPIESEEFTWIGSDGKRHFNGYATVETGLPIAKQMLETMALSEVGAGALSLVGRTASTVGRVALGAERAALLGERVAATPILSQAINVAKNPEVYNRLKTFASVYSTTYPRALTEEYNNFKNAEDVENVAKLRAVVEAFTESFVPNTPDLFKTGAGSLLGIGKKQYAKDLAAGLDGTILGMFPGASNKFLKNFGKSAASQRAVGMIGDLFQEAVIEEEASLIGNYFVDKVAKSKNEEYITQNELTFSNIVDTALEATAGMLLTAPFMGGGTKRANNQAILSARWNIANNPDLFKSAIVDQLRRGDITEEVAAQKIAKVDQYSQALKSLPIKNLSSVRDMKNLLEDKDAQYQFFSDYLEKEALLNYVPTEEELPEYTKQLESIDANLYRIQKRADQFDNLTVSDKKKIIYDNFKDKYNTLINHDDVSPAAVTAAMARAQDDLDKNKNRLFSTELEGYINDLDSSMEGVMDKFKSFIINNNEGLTYEQRGYKEGLYNLNKSFYSSEDAKQMEDALLEAAYTATAPFFNIQDENEFIESLARNYVTAKENEKPITSNGKYFYDVIEEQYVNDGLFTRFVEGLPEEEQAEAKEKLKERFWNRVVELKNSQEPGQAFPEVNRTPVTTEEKFEQQTQQALPKYKQFIARYNEAAEKGLGEDLQMIQEEALDEVLKEADLESIISGLASLQSIFPSEDLVAIAENARQGKTLGLETFLSNYGATEKQIENLRKKLAPTQEVKEEAKEEGKKPTETKTDIEAKKADIERRRQEELDKVNKRIEKINKGDDSNIRVKVETYRTLDINDNPVEVEIITNKDGSRVLKARAINEDGSIDPMPYVTERINNKAQLSLTNEKLIEGYIGNEGESLSKISESNNPNQDYIDKINAKYDAELAALQGIELEEVPVGIELGPVGEFVVIEEPSTKDDVIAQEGYEQQTKAVQQVEQATPAPSQRENYVALGITDTAADNTTRLEDPNTAFVFAFIDTIDNSINSLDMSSLGYHLFMKSDKDIFAKVGIEPEYKEDLKEFAAQFIINGIPVISQAQIEFYHKQFNKIGSYKLGVITDKDGNVLYFDQTGQQLPEGMVGTPIITNIGQVGGKAKASDAAFKNAIPPQGQIALLSQFANGREIVKKPIKLADPNNLILNLDGTQEVKIGEKTYTLHNGVIYYKTGNAFVPYRSTYGRQNTKETAEEVLALIEAYNFSKLNPEQATLPEYFTTMPPNDFIRYIQNYAFLSPKSETGVGIVPIAKPGETVPSLVRIYKDKDKTKEVSREDAINIIAATNANPNRAFFEGERVFRPFTVENGKVKVGKEINFKTWFADSKKSGARIDGVANRNLRFAKQDVITLAPEGIVSRPIETKPENLLLENLLIPQDSKDIVPTEEAPVSRETNVERIEIPRYFTFDELGGAKGKSGKAMSSVEADKNAEIEENFKKQLKEGDKLIEPDGTITYFKNGKVVKKDGSLYGMVDIPAFTNGVTIERTKVVTTEPKAEIEIVASSEKLKNQNQVFQSPSGKFGVLSAKDNKTIIWSNTLEQAKEKAGIERRRQEELIETPRAYSDPTMGYTVEYLVENGIIEGPIVKPGISTYLRIKEGIDKLNAEINAKYDAEVAALEGAKPETKEKRRRPGRGEGGGIILERSKQLRNEITERQNQAAKQWIDTIGKKIFGEGRIVFEQFITNPRAWAVWSEAGMRLFADANFAEGYHESWHEFTQMFFTPKQREALYKEAAKIYGKELSQQELEEAIAEDFRQFMLTRVMPESLQKYKSTRTVFQKIADFVRNLFSNKKTLDRYFENLAKGKVGKRVGKPGFQTLTSAKTLSLYNEDDKLTPLTYQESKRYLDMVDELFVMMGDNVVLDSIENAKQQAIANYKDSLPEGTEPSEEEISQIEEAYNKEREGASYISLMYTTSNLKSVYDSIYDYLVALEEDAAEVGDLVSEAEFSKIFGTTSENIEQIFRYHRTHSNLFTEEMASELDELDNEQAGDTNITSTEIGKKSQKELAPPVVLNLIRFLPLVNDKGQIVENALTGAPMFGDFTTNWNILKNTLAGSTDYMEMIDRIEKLAQSYPQFQYLLNRLPLTIKRNSDQQLRNEFFNIMSMEKVEGIVAKFTSDGEFKISNTGTLDLKRITDLWALQFSVEKAGEYKKTASKTNTYILDPKIFEVYSTEPKSIEDVLGFLKGIGFNYSQRAQEAFRENFESLRKDVHAIYNKLKSATLQPGVEIVDPFQAISKGHTDIRTNKKINGKSYNLNRLIEVESKNNLAFANDMIQVADSTMQYITNTPTYQTKVVAALNDPKFEYYEDIAALYPELDINKNFGLDGSHYLEYLFDFTSPVMVKGKEKHRRIYTDGKPRSLKVVSLNGISTDSDYLFNKKTIDLLEPEKHLGDIRTLLNSYGRTEENNRIGDKSTTRGLLPDSPNYYLYQFDSYYQNGQFNPRPEIWNILYKYIAAEAKVAGKTSVSENFNRNKMVDGVPSLAYFSEILNPDLRVSLYEFFQNNTIEDFEMSPLRNQVKQEMLAWISARAQDSQEVIKGFSTAEISAATGGKTNELQVSSDELKRYHLLSMINRIEQYKLFNFHPFYYKNAKEVEKRISASNATGTYSVIDQDNLDYTKNTLTNQAVFNEYADKEGIEVKPRKGTDADVTYLVFEDQALDSETARNHKEDYGIHYNSYAERSKKADVQDASSVLTLDFFRKFYATAKGLTSNMKKELDRQNTIWTNLLELKRNPRNEVARKNMMDALNTNPYYIFSVKKLQLYGPGITDTEVVPVFHKYSNKVLLPSEMVDNEQMFQIASKLFASNADYGVFSTGTKIAETTEAIPLFDNEGKVISSGSEAAVTSLRYLKEQQEVEYKADKNTIFATQFRKLLFKDVKTEEEKQLFTVYKEYVRLLTDYDKNKFLDKINDKEAAAKFLVEELSKKNVSAITKDLIRIKEDNKDLAYTIDSLIERTMAESAIVSALKKSIIRQKFHGSQFVQFPVSLIRPETKLKFYRKENGKIASAEAIISFSEKYYSLLDLPFDNKTTIGKRGEDGKPINPYNALKRLNQKLKEDPEFRKKYRDSLTLAGLRIPGQGYNSMEKVEIVEFLPEESGKIILVPDEIVVKSGGDFDIDKLFMYEPVLRNGVMLTPANSAEAQLKELLAKATPKTKEDIEKGAALTKMDIQDFIKKTGYTVASIEEVRQYESDVKYLESQIEREERSILQNNLLNVIKERLSQPEIFEDLIEPNNTKDIDEAAKSVPDYLTGDVNKRIKDEGRDMWSNLVNPLYQLYVFELAHAVEMVGIAAKANTFQTSAQSAKLEIIDKSAIELIPFEVNLSPEGNIKLWEIYDVDKKNKISQIISQVISGAVDIVKNDNILKTNINAKTVSVALYLNSMGVRFKDITKFLKEKTIYDYSKGKSFKDTLKEYGMYEEFKSLGARGFSEYKTALKVVEGMDKSKFLTDNSDLGKLRRLATFIILQSQQSRNILPLSQGTDFDTQSFQNFEDVTRKQKDLNKVAKNKFFNPSGFKKMIEDSPVSSFQITEEFIDIFEDLFPISANKGVMDFIQSTYDSLVMEATYPVLVDYENFSRRFKNALLTSILESNMSEFKTYADYLRVDPTIKNLEDMASELKSKAAEYGAYVPLLDEIIFQGNVNSDYISPGIMKNDSSLDIDVKKEQFAYNLNWEPMAGEKVPQEFKQQVRDFFRIFAYTGIISTQLNKTPFSFLEIIPEQIYTPVIDKFVRETAKDLKKGKDSDYLNNFYLRFYVNNPDIFRTGEMGTIPNPSLKFYRNYNLNASPEEVSAEYTNVVPRTTAETTGGILVTNEPGLVESRGSIEGFAPKESKFAISPGFQGYQGGFENTGKGTPRGDGKDKAMRQVADGFIGEHKPVNIQTSTRTSFNDITFKLQEREGVRQGNSNFAFETQDKFSKNYDHRYEGKSGKTEIIGVFKNPKVVMLARNGEYKGEDLNDNTKGLILEAYNQGAEFVVGDMPGVDSQFIDYLQEIGAKFTIYHTGFNPRIQITTPSVFEEPKPETYEVDEMTSQNSQSIFNVLPIDTPADQNIIDKANDLPDDESSCNFNPNK